MKKPAYMFNDPNDKIDEKKPITYGCGDEYELLKYIPQNGEYQWAGESDDYDPACCGKPTGHYKRTSYLADNKECCKNLTSTIGNKTCNPAYRGPFTSECDTIMKEYCLDNTPEAHKNNIFTQPSCSLWCTKNDGTKEICKQKKTTLCNDANNLQSSECKQWCLENPGQCDKGMTDYCVKPENIHDPICTCINSFVDFKDRDINNPRCVDKNCILTGYSTAAMMNNNVKCQNISCDVYYDMHENDRVNIHENYISQTCGGKTTAPHTLVQKLKSHPWFNFHNTMTEDHKRILIVSALLILLFILVSLKQI